MRFNQHGPFKEILCLGNASAIVTHNRKGNEEEPVR